MPVVAPQHGQKSRLAQWKCVAFPFPPTPAGRLRNSCAGHKRRNEEYPHDGHSNAGAGLRLLRPCDRLHLRLRTAVRERTMIFDYALAGTVSFGLLFYLTYALLRPERF